MAQQFGMGMSMTQTMKQTQRLIMTPQMQQSIQLLQMNTIELEQLAQQEMLENPFLEMNMEEADPSEGAEAAEAGASDRAESIDSDDAAPTGTEPDAPPERPDQDDSPSEEKSEKEKASDDSNDDPPELANEKPDEKFEEVDADWEDYYDGNEAPVTRAASTREAPEDETDFSEYTALKVSLKERLEWQLDTAVMEPEQRRIGEYIINNINADGYLVATDEVDKDGRAKFSIIDQDPDESIRIIARDFEVDEDDVLATLRIIHTFDPTGIGARNLAECLSIQLRENHVKDPVLYRILDEFFELFVRRRVKELAKALEISEEETSKAFDRLTRLEPRPGRSYTTESPHYVKPDVYVKEMDGKYVYYLNEGDIGRLKINDYYRNLLSKSAVNMTDKERSYTEDKFRSAMWLLKNMEKRKSTILAVTEAIMEYQKEFLDKGIEFLRPLILRQIAEEVGMHESTIARVTNSKYVETPRGTFSLKYFFSSSLEKEDGESASSRSIKEMIREIINSEDGKKPLSDQKISNLLADKNIKIARRTVAKYREQMKRSLPAKMRKQV